MKRKPKEPKFSFWLKELSTGNLQKKVLMTQEEANEHNKNCEVKGYDFRWVQPVFPDLKGRHVASLRSICETLGPNGKKPHCTCGKVYNDPIHFKTKELDVMSPEARMVAYGNV